MVSSQNSDRSLTIMAHQGWQGAYPSNSYQAIVSAFYGAGAVEFDVYKVIDAKGGARIVCAHPESYFLYVDQKGMKNDGEFPLSYEDAIAVNVRGAELMPDLEKVLEAWRKSGAHTEIQIELKGPGIPEVLVPLLQRKAAEGYPVQNILLTGLCYPGDRSRIEDARRMSSDIRLVLPLRGGDFAQDGFADIDDVLTFAREQNVEVITIHRKNLDRALVDKIKDAGFITGTYHLRTTDELAAAVTLGVSYVAADFMLMSVADYLAYRDISDEVYDRLLELGFFAARDWIWENSWDLEKRFRAKVPEYCSVAPGTSDALFSLDFQFGTAGARVYHAQQQMVSFDLLAVSDEVIKSEFLGSFDLELFGEAAKVYDFCSERGVLAQWRRLTSEFNCHSKVVTVADIAALSEPVSQHRALPTIERELAHALLWRLGRIIGMLSFAVLNPRHGKQAKYTTQLDCDFVRNTPLVAQAAVEQFNAQLLRSGAFGELYID
jgi:glycerophosphoryl diester phosphodiesterase